MNTVFLNSIKAKFAQKGNDFRHTLVVVTIPVDFPASWKEKVDKLGLICIINHLVVLGMFFTNK